MTNLGFRIYVEGVLKFSETVTVPKAATAQEALNDEAMLRHARKHLAIVGDVNRAHMIEIEFLAGRDRRRGPAEMERGEMTNERFQKLLDGPLSSQLLPFHLTRLILALRAVVEATGAAGERALEDFCAERERQDREQDRELEDGGGGIADELAGAKSSSSPASQTTCDSLGCCGCGQSIVTRLNVVMLDHKAAIAGTGWGCVQCGLPTDGAYAILCDLCAEADPIVGSIREAVVGYPRGGGREPIEVTNARPRHEHDMSKHPEIGDPAGVQ